MITDQDLDEMLDGFRDDVPEMSDTGFLLGKVRLQAAVQDSSAEPVMPAQSLLVRVEYVDGRNHRSPPRRWKVTPWVIAAAALSALMIGATLLVNTGQPVTPAGGTLQTDVPQLPRQPYRSGEGRALLPYATQPYNEAGSLVANVSDLPQRPGQYLYTHKEESKYGDTVETHGQFQVTSITVNRSDEWVPHDRTAIWRLRLAADSSSPVTFEGAGGVYSQAPGTWLDPTNPFIASLPRDPKLLYNRLAQDSNTAGTDPPSTAFQMARAVLSRPVPAEFRRTLLQALSYHPWIVIGETQTRDGQEVVSLGFDDQLTGHSETMLIDPASGLLVATKSTKPPGRVTQESFVRWSIVDKLGDTR